MVMYITIIHLTGSTVGSLSVLYTKDLIVFGTFFRGPSNDSRRANCHLLAKESKLNTGKLPAEGLPGNSVDY